MYRTRQFLALVLLVVSGTGGIVFAGAPPADAPSAASAQAADAAAAEQMKRRFPQKVRVGDLLGLALQDEDDRVLGHVERVLRKSNGRIVLVTTYGAWFGIGGRHVGVPLETVAILARHIDVLDIPRNDFPSLPTWNDTGAVIIAPDETIRIAITRR
jgi:PRC-barrel domain